MQPPCPLVRLRAFGYARAMISVLIETLNDEEALARTLASLVGGAVEGVVREVIIRDRGSTDHTVAVAEHAGCTLVTGGDPAQALRRARSDWLLLLEPGARLVDGWTQPVMDHASNGDAPARFTTSPAWRPPLLLRPFRRGRPLSDGLLIMKSRAVARTGASERIAALALGLPARRLGAEIVPAPSGRASA